MSGGSLDYVYNKVSDAAGCIRSLSKKPIHLAFAKHLDLVSKALYDLELVFSHDCSYPSEERAIQACLKENDELTSAREEAEKVLKNLQEVLEKSKKSQRRGSTTLP